MKAGFVLTVQPLLFGGYVHGPQVPRSVCGPRRENAVLGLLFMGGKCSKPSAPVGEGPKVSEDKKKLGRLFGKAVGENKEKTVKAKNKPSKRSKTQASSRTNTGKKARPVKQISLFHT